MSGRHTPGPWIAERSEVVGVDGTLIAIGLASCHSYQTWVIDPKKGKLAHTPEAQANARLIAAAPDLLEALMDILGPLNVCSLNANIPAEECIPIDITMGELRRARAAIAKATAS